MPKFTKIERLRILSSYGVKNTLDWVLRDWVQNFYDAQKAKDRENPFDHIKVEFSTDSDVPWMTIFGDTYFDMEYLLFVGATSKAGNSKFIGEKGEGLKITTLLALRDFGFEVYYESHNGASGWGAQAFFDDVTIGGKPEKELCFNIEQFGSILNGTKIMITAKTEKAKENLAQLQKMNYQEWFAHSRNNYLLPGNKITEHIYRKQGGSEGRLFLAGIDRGEDYRLSFVYKVDTKLKADNDRDRKTLSAVALSEALKVCLGTGNVPYEVYSKIFSASEGDLLKDWSYDEEISAIKKNPNFLDYFKVYFKDRMHKLTYAESSNTDCDNGTLERLGVKLVTDHRLVEILRSKRVKSLEIMISGIQSAEKVKAEGPTLNKVKLLQTVVSSAGIEAKRIEVFAPSTSESHIMGTYNTDYVRLNVCLFEGKGNTFANALATYLHELAHVAGSDESASFSDKLTEYIGFVFGQLLDADRAEGQMMMLLNATKGWNNLNK